MPPLAFRVRALLSAPDRLLWALRVRWLVIVGFLLLAIVAHALGLFASIVPCVEAAAVGTLLNTLNEWCVRRRRYIFPVTALAIPLDHVFITYVVVHTGGVQSPFLMLYVVQVVATAMLVDTVVAAGSVLWAIVLWVGGVSLQAAGYIEVPPLFPPGAPESAVLYRGTWAAFLFYCLALLVYLGGYISERLRSSERDLEEKNRRLHATVESLGAAHQELREAYDRLQQTEAHLIQSEKMRSLGQLVAGVAHELNNPISFVSANVEHLRTYIDRLAQALDAYAHAVAPEARPGLDAMRRELRIDAALADLPALLQDCEEGARRTKRIVNGLRAFSRSDERETWQRADLHGGIDTTLALLANRFKDHINVHRDFGALPEIDCVPGQLNQVFMNLLANAADAIGQKAGNIWISTGADDGTSVTVSIRDDGAGMLPETVARVFDPFFTTKPVGQGTGLGLSVSYGIVQRHGGALRATSAPGAGSTFTITLPVRRSAD